MEKYYAHITNNELNGVGLAPIIESEGTFSLEITKEVYDEIVENNDKYLFSNNEVVLNPNFESIVRIKKIEEEVQTIEKEYAEYLDTEVAYTNGKTYRIRYAEESYQPLISAEMSLQVMKNTLAEGETLPVQSTFPLLIWDSSKLEENAVQLTCSELSQLALYLTNLQQTAWNERKTRIAALEAERLALKNSLNA